MFGPGRFSCFLDNLIEKLGLRGARADHQNVDPVPRKFRPQRFRKPLYGELASRIFAVVRRTPQSHNRTYVDDDRPCALVQKRQRQPRQLNRGEKVYLHHGSCPPRVRFFERAHGPHAGIVHQDIEPAEPRPHGLDRRPPRGVFGDIAHNRLDLTAHSGGFLGQFGKTFFASGNRHNSRALADQFQGDRPPYPARCARNNRSAVFDFASCHLKMCLVGCF